MLLQHSSSSGLDALICLASGVIMSAGDGWLSLICSGLVGAGTAAALVVIVAGTVAALVAIVAWTAVAIVAAAKSGAGIAPVSAVL